MSEVSATGIAREGPTAEASARLWYFAFGANMSSDVLTRRRVRPLASEPARLDDHVLFFGERGIPLLEPGFATIGTAPGETVWGVLHRLRAGDLDVLRSYEGNTYSRRRVSVVGRDSGEVEAWVFSSRHPVQGLRPSTRYLDTLLAGAREHGLPEDYVTRLERQPSVRVPFLSRRIPRTLEAIERSEFRARVFTGLVDLWWRLVRAIRGR
jgi:hypothetical protein